MDRRTALKKMAVGSAAVAGASMVTTKAAFAYAQPTITTHPTISYAGSTDIVSTNQSKMRLQVVPGAASCPGSATSSSATVSALTIEVAARLRLTNGNDSNPGSNSNRRVLRPFYSGQSWSYGTPQINHSSAGPGGLPSAFKSFNVLNAGHTPNYSIRFTKCSSSSSSDPAPTGNLGHGGTDTAYRSGDRLRLRVALTWRCAYPDGTTRTRSQTYEGVIRPPGSGDASGWNGTSNWTIVNQLAAV